MTDDALDRQAADLSSALKAFHKALIQAEVGDDTTLDNPYSQLFALIGDPRFAWMGAVSRLITRIDEALAARADEQPDLGTLLPQWRDEAAALIGEGTREPDPDFRMRHLMALQNEPHVGLATGKLRQALARQSGSGAEGQ